MAEKISYNELLSALEQEQAKQDRRKAWRDLTREQVEFLRKAYIDAPEHQRISLQKLSAMWEECWEKLSRQAIADRINIIKQADIKPDDIDANS